MKPWLHHLTVWQQQAQYPLIILVRPQNRLQVWKLLFMSSATQNILKFETNVV